MSKKKIINNKNKTNKEKKLFGKINKKRAIIIFSIVAIISCILLLIFYFGFNRQYKVSFNSTGGSNVESVKTSKGGQLLLPNDIPYKENKIFNGWLWNEKLVLSGTIINEDIELKASWVDLDYEYIHVIYSPGYNIEDVDVLVEKNQRATPPNDPVLKNMKFLGWYIENEEFDFDARLNNNIVLVGKWEEAKDSTNDSVNKCYGLTYEYKDNKCTKIISIRPQKKYICEEGWEVIGENCIKPNLTGNQTEATPIYTCENGYELKENKCEKQLTATPSSSYKCSYGTLEGQKCYVYEEETVYVASLGGRTEEQKKQMRYEQEIKCTNRGGIFKNYSDKIKCVVTKKVSKGQAKTVYNCPTGYKLSNGICSKISSLNATIKNYICPGGYLLVNNKCYEKSNTIQKQDAKINLYCYSGFELKEGKCQTKISINNID